MTQLEMFQKSIQGNAIQRAPGAVQVLTRLRLLSAVVIVQELVHDLQSLRLIHLATPPTAPTAAVAIANVTAAVIASLCFTKIIQTNQQLLKGTLKLILRNERHLWGKDIYLSIREDCL
jgi:hypothetical protein